MKKLSELEPSFVGNYHEGTGDGDPTTYQLLPSADGAQGVLFTCPKCENRSVLCWFKNPRNAPVVPDSATPKPGRWTFTGDTFDVLTLQPSIDLSRVSADNPEHPSRCYWHGWVEQGNFR